MIGRLHGILLARQAPHLLVEVQGIGYEIEAPMTTFYELPAIGEQVTLHTHLMVREDAHLLYGFASESERALFRSLIKVSGVGAKLALAILSGISAAGFVQCIHHNDAATLTRLPGIGKKTAERLILEMRDRLADWQPAAPASSANIVGIAQSGVANNQVGDAISALVTLGYKPQEASRMVHAVDAAGLSSEQIIRLALQSLIRG
ncbi:MAG TPA: Holliday junction branch migration protein RuvA [Gammaproteobacteria bacterium]|nr:Holliday junction branch migration protein RuvA [Gammaproteobacteria bacterium]